MHINTQHLLAVVINLALFALALYLIVRLSRRSRQHVPREREEYRQIEDRFTTLMAELKELDETLKKERQN